VSSSARLKPNSPLPCAASSAPRVALVHDWLNQYGGAERVLEHLVDLFPGAPIFTSIYDRRRLPAAYEAWDIRTTWMDRLPGIYAHHQVYFPLYAMAFAAMRVAGGGTSPGHPQKRGGETVDLVISNKSGFCHAIRTGSVPHLCYCLAPTRYVWQFDSYAAREQLSGAARLLLNPLVQLLRRWDFAAAQRSTLHFVAISREIQSRIRRYYHRDSVVVYPPVDVDRFVPLANPSDRTDAYLVVSRLVPYKRIDLAVRAFSELGLPLVIAGEGRDRPALEALAGPTVRFLGRVPDADLPDLLASCRAFIFPGEEDFGIAPVEAQAAGRPVIAYRAGGALDTVIEGRTGAFFDDPTVESLAAAVGAFDADALDPADIRAHAETFSVSRFRRELLYEVARLLGD
jgi:glycosyltransferase involved in cell wall biosynthesis